MSRTSKHRRGVASRRFLGKRDRRRCGTPCFFYFQRDCAGRCPRPGAPHRSWGMSIHRAMHRCGSTTAGWLGSVTAGSSSLTSVIRGRRGALETSTSDSIRKSQCAATASWRRTRSMVTIVISHRLPDPRLRTDCGRSDRAARHHSVRLTVSGRHWGRERSGVHRYACRPTDPGSLERRGPGVTRPSRRVVAAGRRHGRGSAGIHRGRGLSDNDGFRFLHPRRVECGCPAAPRKRRRQRPEDGYSR